MHFCCPTASSQNSPDHSLSYEYLDGREYALVEAYNQSLVPTAQIDIRAITVLHEGEERRLEMSVNPSSWGEHHERKGYLVSSHLLSWRRAYFTKMGRRLDSQVLESLGTFEYQLRLSLYPSLDEIEHRASELSGVLLGAYQRIKRLEWSFLSIVIYKLCHEFSQPLDTYITQISHKLDNLVSFVEFFYDSMAQHMKIYDVSPWWTTLDCFYCCHQIGEYEQQLVALKQQHMSRLDLAELLTALHDIKQHDVCALVGRYGGTSSEETMAMPLIREHTEPDACGGRDV